MFKGFLEGVYTSLALHNNLKLGLELVEKLLCTQAFAV